MYCGSFEVPLKFLNFEHIEEVIYKLISLDIIKNYPTKVSEDGYIGDITINYQTGAFQVLSYSFEEGRRNKLARFEYSKDISGSECDLFEQNIKYISDQMRQT